MGLLDSGVFDSDQFRLGMGLLAAGGARSDGANTGQRLQEALGGLDAYKANKLKQRMVEMQMAEQQSQIEQARGLREAASSSFRSPDMANAMSMGPAMGGGSVPQVQPGFDSQGYINKLYGMGMPDKALAHQAAIQKESTINKLDVKDFTPASVAKYAQTRNYGDLVRLDKAHFADVGGSVAALDPFTGRPLNSMAKTQSPDNAANNSVTMRGQNMTDSRARDFNAITQQTNSIKLGEKDAEKNLAKQGQLASFDVMLGSLDRLSNHPGLGRSVGVVGAFPTMPGSESANFKAELDTFQSQAFLPMVSQLKGMGALSDAEGKKLTAAVGALSPSMGEKAFRESIARINADMSAARDRLAGTTRTAPKSLGGWSIQKVN